VQTQHQYFERGCNVTGWSASIGDTVFELERYGCDVTVFVWWDWVQLIISLIKFNNVYGNYILILLKKKLVQLIVKILIILQNFHIYLSYEGFTCERCRIFLSCWQWWQMRSRSRCCVTYFERTNLKYKLFYCMNISRLSWDSFLNYRKMRIKVLKLFNTT
jgi:hypothetical protein